MNRVVIIGNLTRDPELRTTPNGVSVCTLSVAVNWRRGEQKGVDYFSCTVWRQVAEACARYLSKGNRVAVSGRVSARAYVGNDGTARASLDVQAEEVEFLSPARGDAAEPEDDYGDY